MGDGLLTQHRAHPRLYLYGVASPDYAQSLLCLMRSVYGSILG
jgi:hypothetical protein